MVREAKSCTGPLRSYGDVPPLGSLQGPVYGSLQDLTEVTFLVYLCRIETLLLRGAAEREVATRWDFLTE